MKALRAAIVGWLLLASFPAHADWSFVSAGTPSSNDGNVAVAPGLPPGHASTDHLLWIGLKRNSANAVVLPTGYAEIFSYTTSTPKYFVVADKIDTGSEVAPVSDPSAGVESAIILAYRGGPTSLVGLVHASAVSGGAACTTTPQTPALTITQDNTLVLLIAYQLDNYTSFTSDPDGFAPAAHFAYDGSGDISLMIAHQIQTTATSIPVENFTTAGAISSTCRGFALSLVAPPAAAAITITSVNTTNTVAYNATARPAVVVGAGASQGASTFKLIDQGGTVKATQTITAWADTLLGFDVVQGNARLGPINWELVVGSDSDTLPGELTTPAGEWYVNIAGLVPLDFNVDGSQPGRYRGQPNRYYDFPNDLANGDQLHCKRTVGSGNLNAIVDGLTKTPGISPTGTFSPDTTVKQIQCRIWHGGAWGTFQTWEFGGRGPVFVGPNP